MINDNGYEKYSIWEHSQTVKDLYAKRCRQETEEMTCAAQAAELLAPIVKSGDILLDAGCGSGYFFHSLQKRKIPVEYHGIDASQSLIKIGKDILPSYGLPSDHLQLMRIEDLDAQVDHIVCMNVLSNIDNYHRPLERILKCSRKSVILRESLSEKGEYAYVPDKFLDPGVELKVHVNTYPLLEVISFIQSHGYKVQNIEDRRTKGSEELVIGYPHYWKFLLATKKS